MKLVFSLRAERNLDSVLEYLLTKFSDTSKQKLIRKLTETIAVIEANPLLYPESEIKKGLRKCVITKFTTLYYKVQKTEIQIVTIQDTRQNPKFKN